MILDSIVKLQYSMDLLRMKSTKWWVLLLISLITAGLAMAILVFPFKTEAGHDPGTICAGAEVLLREGAREVYACATHGVLSGPALERLNNSVFTKVVVTDTIPSGERLDVCSKLQVVSVASLLAKSIHNIHTGSSVSVLF